MSNTEHHAIIIGIGDYALESLDLKGPVNDAKDFYTWLRDPHGGDLDEGNIHRILSTDYRAGEGNPTPNQIEALFRPFIVQGVQGEKCGERLYIFAAGHGFGDPYDMRATAIYAADAEKLFPSHVAVTHYAEWLRRHAVFDEIILIMDCCRTINRLHVIREPQYPATSGHPEASRVRYFYAFAVGRKKIAREREFEDGKYHGIFTKAVLNALEIAKSSDGKITGQLLKDQIHTSIHTIDPSVDPPEIQLDSHRDITFLTRQTANAAQIQVIVDPHSGQETLILCNSNYEEIYREMAVTSNITLHLEQGLYKIVIENTNRQTVFEVPNNEQITITV